MVISGRLVALGPLSYQHGNIWPIGACINLSLLNITTRCSHMQGQLDERKRSTLISHVSLDILPPIPTSEIPPKNIFHLPILFQSGLLSEMKSQRNKSDFF